MYLAEYALLIHANDLSQHPQVVVVVVNEVHELLLEPFELRVPVWEGAKKMERRGEERERERVRQTERARQTEREREREPERQRETEKVGDRKGGRDIEIEIIDEERTQIYEKVRM